MNRGAGFQYPRFSTTQLNKLASVKKYCVEKHLHTTYLSFPPWGLNNFKETLLSLITRRKVGYYDNELKGIILDAKNIRVVGDFCPLYNDTAAFTIDFKADFYVFKPILYAQVKCLILHSSELQITALIYRAFYVSIVLNSKSKVRLSKQDEILLKITNFDIQNKLPFIEGEIVRYTKYQKWNAHNDRKNYDSGICTEEKEYNGQSHIDSMDTIQTELKIETTSTENTVKKNKVRAASPAKERKRTVSNSDGLKSTLTKKINKKADTSRTIDGSSEEVCSSPSKKRKRTVSKSKESVSSETDEMKLKSSSSIQEKSFKSQKKRSKPNKELNDDSGDDLVPTDSISNSILQLVSRMKTEKATTPKKQTALSVETPVVGRQNRRISFSLKENGTDKPIGKNAPNSFAVKEEHNTSADELFITPAKVPHKYLKLTPKPEKYASDAESVQRKKIKQEQLTTDDEIPGTSHRKLKKFTKTVKSKSNGSDLNDSSEPTFNDSVKELMQRFKTKNRNGSDDSDSSKSNKITGNSQLASTVKTEETNEITDNGKAKKLRKKSISITNKSSESEVNLSDSITSLLSKFKSKSK